MLGKTFEWFRRNFDVVIVIILTFCIFGLAVMYPVEIPPVDHEPYMVQLYGYVLDSSTEKPISNAAVNISLVDGSFVEMLITAVDGKFITSAVYEGNSYVVISIIAANFSYYEEVVYIPEMSPYQEVYYIGTFYLTPSGNLYAGFITVYTVVT